METSQVLIRNLAAKDDQVHEYRNQTVTGKVFFYFGLGLTEKGFGHFSAHMINESLL